MSVRIMFRRGTAAEWALVNPVLASGEVGFETDTNKLKVGTGSLAWNSLGYVEGVVSSLNFGVTSITGSLAVANGGTGVASLAAGQILVGNGVLPMSGLAGSASGEFLRWNASTNAWSGTALTGTANQITVTSDATTTTLSLPQSIASASSPTFAGLTVNGTGSSRINFSTNAEIRPASDSALRLVPGGTNNTFFMWAATNSAAAGHNLFIQGGATSASGGKAGDLSLVGGSGSSGTNTGGGDLYLRGGPASGTGTLGIISLGRTSSATAGASAVNIGHSSITTTVFGTLVSTTAAVDTNTTQVATTAYVVGQGYLKSATATSTYAPLASPTFTGTVTITSKLALSNLASGVSTNDLMQWNGTTWARAAGQALSTAASPTFYGLTLNPSGYPTATLTVADTGNTTQTHLSIRGAQTFTASAVGGELRLSGGLANNGTGGDVVIDGGTGSSLATSGDVLLGGINTNNVYIGGKRIDIGRAWYDTGTTTISIGSFAPTATTTYLIGSVAINALTGYTKANGTSPLTASATIPASDITGLSGTYAPLASPTFTGTVALPSGSTGTTPATSDNSTKLATTAFVKAQGYVANGTLPYDVSGEVGGIPVGGSEIFHFKSVRPWTLASSGHQGGQIGNPTADVQCSVFLGTTPVGTITFGANGTFSSNITQTSFLAGNVLMVTAPNDVRGLTGPYWTFIGSVA
jgi:hypothetical protein